MNGGRRVGVLISGRGSNMRELITAARRTNYPAEVVLALSDKADAPGLALARAAGVAAQAIPSKAYPDRKATSGRWTGRCAPPASKCWPWPATCAC